jgi:hypothetical protein
MSNCWLDIYNLTYDMYIRDFILFIFIRISFYPRGICVLWSWNMAGLWARLMGSFLVCLFLMSLIG